MRGRFCELLWFIESYYVYHLNSRFFILIALVCRLVAMALCSTPLGVGFYAVAW